MKKILIILIGALMLTIAAHAETCVNIEDYGGSGNGTTDNTPALTSAIAALKGNKKRCIHFGVGRYSFNTPPPAIDVGIILDGENRPETMLIRNYNGSTYPTFIEFEGGWVDPSVSGTVYGGSGGGIRNMQLMAANGTSGGIAIWLLARPCSTAVPTTSMVTLENIEVLGEGSTRGSWNYSLYVDGSQATYIYPVPLGCTLYGIRDIFVHNSQFMDATIMNITVNRGVAVYFDDLGVYAGGTGRNADLQILTPTNDPTSKSAEIYVNGNINGVLNIINSVGIRATGVFGSVSSSGNSDCIANGVGC
jgi:hypothetical protein